MLNSIRGHEISDPKSMQFMQILKNIFCFIQINVKNPSTSFEIKYKLLSN